ncbi:cation:proton antiporter domain-containing protein [Paraburkholderia lycopersici]|uniref:NhaP-type Na+/H+ or K+/H+ antiporter n=1 Tax=Paraburkholderia lycopersici TaxID=416944 RepID=A0A1G7C081_9BURK|nr:cation:proton antiporter [Paraburkholderia lycopersici]SDE32731.1 NhaP-type Na+/H+ or K+/H+ antiporter [Paraburkholderia lycopersici]
MREEALWFLLVGVLLMFVALARGPIARLPLTGAMIYLVVGIVAGPGLLGLVHTDLAKNVRTLSVVAEAGLVISLFSVGMHLRVRLRDRLWRLPVRLGVVAMVVSVALMFAFGVATGAASGVALFLAAALAPTDPVLANELRVHEAGDAEPVRFALSGEGGLNDGAAMPFALLGLALLGVRTAGTQSAAAFALSVAWGIAGALLVGVMFGTLCVRLVLHLRTRYGEAVGLDGFIAIGLMSVSYGVALLLHAYAFVAVFAAGVALRHEELRATGERRPAQALEDVQLGERTEVAKDPERAHAWLAEGMTGFTLEIERFAEFSVLLIIGCVISAHWRDMLDLRAMLCALALVFVVRPLAVFAAMAGANADRSQRLLMAWMGIRGVGAFYYAVWGLDQAGDALQPVLPAALDAIVVSVVLHGATARYVLERYYRRQEAAAASEREWQARQTFD